MSELTAQNEKISVSDFGYTPLIDQSLGLDVSADTLKIYAKYLSSKFRKNGDVIDDEPIAPDKLELILKQMLTRENKQIIQRFKDHGQTGIPVSEKETLRRNVLDGKFALRVAQALNSLDLGDGVAFEESFVKHDLPDPTDTTKSDLYRLGQVQKSQNELNALVANTFGTNENFPRSYAEILQNYMTNESFNKLQKSFYVQSVENKDLVQKQAKRAIDVLETLEKHYKGMYRIVTHQTNPSQIIAELLDVNGAKITLLPPRDGVKNDPGYALRDVGTVATRDNIFALARSISEPAYGREADTRPVEDIPANLVMRAILLNTTDATGKDRLEFGSMDAVSLKAINTPKNEEPTLNELQSRESKGYSSRKRETTNELIRKGQTSGRTTSVFGVRFRSERGVEQTSILGLPQSPGDSLQALGEDKTFALQMAIDRAAKEADISAATALQAAAEEREESDLELMFEDTITDDAVSLDDFVTSLMDINEATDTADINFTGVSTLDAVEEIKRRMDFTSGNVRTKKVDFSTRDLESDPLRGMDKFLYDDLRRMGVNPSYLEVNEAGTYRIHVPGIFQNKDDLYGGDNVIHVPLGNLMNAQVLGRDADNNAILAYSIKSNGSLKGVFVPGYRGTVNRDNGELQVTRFQDIVRQNIHKLILDQLVNPAYANDTLDPYTRLDKLFTVDGYGTLFQDMDPNNLTPDQTIIVQQASRKVRLMTEITNSATMFNEIRDRRLTDTRNERLKFTNNESIRTLAIKYWNVIDPYKVSPDGATLYMGVDTKIGPDGTLYSDDVPQLTDLTNSELKGTQGELLSQKLIDLPVAESPLTLAMPTSKFDSPVRSSATSHQYARLGGEHAKIKANLAYLPFGGHGIGDGFVVSKEFAENTIVALGSGKSRTLITGDKLTDGHGNKGLAVTVVDLEDTDPKLAAARAVFAANPDLNVVGPFAALISRGTGAAGVEAAETFVGHLNNAELDGKVIQLDDKSYSNMDMIISDMVVDKKTIVYTDEAYRVSGKGRSASSQFNAVLTALGATETLKHIYSSGEYKDQTKSHSRLIADLNILGYDIDKDGNFGLIDNGALVEDPRTIVFEPNSGVAFRDMVSRAAAQKGVDRVAIRLPQELNLESGQSTKARMSDGTSQNVLFMPISYLDELDAMGQENRELITKDAYRNNLKAVYDIVAGTKLDRSLVDAVSRLSNTVKAREFVNKDTNVVKNGIYKVQLKHSSTSVVTADPTLDLMTMKVSPAIYKNMGEPDPDHRMLVWRDPMLRPTNMAAYKIVVDEDITGVAFNPVLADKMDGDFDGDTFGTFYTNNPDVQEEWATKLAAENPLQYKRYNLDGEHETLLDVNGDVELPYRIKQRDIGSSIINSLNESEQLYEVFKEMYEKAVELGDFDLQTAMDELVYDASPEYITDSTIEDVAPSEIEVVMMQHREFNIRLNDVMKSPELVSILEKHGAITPEQIETYETVESDLHKMHTGDATYEQLSEMIVDNGLNQPEAFGGFGLNAESRDTVEDSIRNAVDFGYKGKTSSISDFMSKFDGDQTVAEYFKETDGTGYKKDFVGLPGSIQQIYIARTRGVDSNDVAVKEGDDLSNAINLDATQQAMRAALNVTWIATDGTLQAKKDPEKGKIIQQLATVDLKNLAKGLPRDYGKKGVEIDFNEQFDRVSTDQWIKEMTDVLINPNTEPDDWNESHPGQIFEPGLNAGDNLDIRDIEILGNALSDDDGYIRTIDDDLKEKRISMYDAVAYGGALFGDPTKSLEIAAKYNLSVKGNKYQDVFEPVNRELWSSSVQNTLTNRKTKPVFEDKSIKDNTMDVGVSGFDETDVVETDSKITSPFDEPQSQMGF